jgi:hypothetical protein
MKYVLSRAEPAGTRILLVESGSRALFENTVPLMRDTWASEFQIDLVTCYGGIPKGFPADTTVYRVHEYNTRERRGELIGQLRSRDYAYLGMICSAEPIMTKWKWLIALKVPAKVFVVNENGDYFWLHRENWPTVKEFALVRAGLYGSDAPRTIFRLLVFPFAVIYLLLYALSAHARRTIRRTFRRGLQN